MDRARQAGTGPFSGWSILIKDIIDWESHATRCGADFLAAESAKQSAKVVQDLVSRGAFVTAKSVTTAFAYVDSSKTKNPWNLKHTPGGSSSGSAAAVACGMARLALGTQTIASINRPASYCGVVGFKPTFGRLPLDGVFPFSPSVDTLGFFTAGVRDAQTAFSALVSEPPLIYHDVLRVGIVTDLRCDMPEAEMQRVVLDTAGCLEDAGHQVVPVALSDMFADAYRYHSTLIAAEAENSHRHLFDVYRDAYPARLRDLLLRGRVVTTEERQRIQGHRARVSAELGRIFECYDVLLSASAPGPAPFGIASTGDPRMSLIWTYTGVPTLTLPAALSSDGLPLGIQLVGARDDDQRLLATGVVLEELLGFGCRPQLHQLG